MKSALTFEPIFKEKVWGGQALKSMLGKELPGDIRIGESWEISGVPGDVSRVNWGAPEGTSLTELLEFDRCSFLGSTPPSCTFPLLYKFIDINERLSVQVHPNDEQARAHGWGEYGKTECWFIIDAQPGTQVVAGFNREVTLEEVRGAIEGERLIDLLNFIDITAGDVVLIHAGTIHANMAGTLLYEVQETSDTTLRLYDWDRNDPARPLHIEESLTVLDTTFHARHKIPAVYIENGRGVLHGFRAACRYFALEEFSFARSAQITLPPKVSFRTLAVITGALLVRWNGGERELNRGESLLLPAYLEDVLVEGSTDTCFLLSSVPDILNEVIRPLRSAGIPDNRIELLGGNPSRNDIAGLLR